MSRLVIILLVIVLAGCDTKTSEDYHRQASEQEHLGNYTQAIALLDKAIEKDQKNIKALLDRGVDKSIIKDYHGAIEDYSMALQWDPTNALAYLNRGRNRKRLGEYKAAIVDFNHAIFIKNGKNRNKLKNSDYDVDMEEVSFERGLAYYDIDSLKPAFDDFSFSIQKKYLLPNSYYWRGLIYLKYNMEREGCDDLTKAMQLGDPNAQKFIDKICNPK